MISNARMYCVTSEVTDHWKRLLESVIGAAGCAMTYLDYPPSAPIDGLWARGDLGAVMMCGLPFSQRVPQPQIVAAPVPAYGTEPRVSLCVGGTLGLTRWRARLEAVSPSQPTARSRVTLRPYNTCLPTVEGRRYFES